MHLVRSYVNYVFFVDMLGIWYLDIYSKIRRWRFWFKKKKKKKKEEKKRHIQMKVQSAW